MGYKGYKVTHKTWGEGIVIKEKEDKITVKFNSQKENKEFLVENIDKYLVLADRVSSVAKESGKSYSTKPKNTVNYAFKCNFCDGGASENCIGFKCACSDENIKYNIEVEKRSFCSYKGSKCRKYYDGLISREDLDGSEEFVCYEAITFTDWIFRAGYDNTETTNTPRRMPGILPGGLCLITTVFPNTKERVIAGAFIIDNVYEGSDIDEGYAQCTTDLHVEFTPREATELKFWDYHVNPNNKESKQWGTGLYRKLTTEESLLFLDRIIEIKKGTVDEDVAKRMKNVFCEKNPIMPRLDRFISSGSMRPVNINEIEFVNRPTGYKA